MQKQSSTTDLTQQAQDLLNLYIKTIGKDLFLRSIKLNGYIIAGSVAVVLLAHYVPSLIVQHTYFRITVEALTSLTLGLAAVAAGILAILVAFATFWFGNAKQRIESARIAIQRELAKLETVMRELRVLMPGPKADVSEPLRSQLQELAAKSKVFYEALFRLASRFQRAAVGTYYDRQELFEMSLLVHGAGGRWFKAYANVDTHNTASERKYCRDLYSDSLDTSTKIEALNGEIHNAHDMIHQVVAFLPTVAAILVVLVASLFTALVGSGSEIRSSSPLTNLLLATILVAMFSVHAITIVLKVSKLAINELALQKRNRASDIVITKLLEEQNPISEEQELQSEALNGIGRGIAKSFLSKNLDT